MINSKSTLAVCNWFKREIREYEVYVTDYNSVLRYKCRGNTLKLGWRSIFVGKDVGCRVCGLGEVRQMSGMEKVPICELLLFGVKGEVVRDKYIRYIGRLCRKREEILKLHDDQRA